MVKNIIEHNEKVLPNDREMKALREHFPSCFEGDSFDIEKFKDLISPKLNIQKEGYELKFLGKNYARLLASLDTTTVIVPDKENNSKEENTNSENIYISGDNLDALKHLLNSYYHKVKCIYIDPPYNTGSDGFVYNDNFTFTPQELSSKLSIDEEEARRILDLTKRGSASHSAWLMFMYPRLMLARDLLTDDGIILISIDENEQANLELLCNDVFGEENHLVTMARRTKNGGGSASDSFAIEHDYICVYGRTKNIELHVPFSQDYLKRYSEEDDKGRYFWDTMERTATGTKPYSITAPDGTELSGKWFRSEARFKSDLETGEVRFLRKADGAWSVQFKQRLAEGKKMRSILGDKEFISHSEDMNNLQMEKVFSYPKTVYLMKYLLQLVKNGSTVLDFFSGSATTAHAVMVENITRIKSNKQPLKYIMVQLPQDLDKTASETTGDAKLYAQNAINLLDSINKPHTLDQIGMERIRRAAKKIKKENPNTKADLGFKHYTLREPSSLILERLERFDPKDKNLFAENILSEFGSETVLETWLVQDGYGLSAKPKTIDLAGYDGYYIEKHVYLLHKDISQDAIISLVTKIETDPLFNPETIALFGYSFTWTELEDLKINLARPKATEKNLSVNIDIRY